MTRVMTEKDKQNRGLRRNGEKESGLDGDKGDRAKRNPE